MGRSQAARETRKLKKKYHSADKKKQLKSAFQQEKKIMEYCEKKVVTQKLNLLKSVKPTNLKNDLTSVSKQRIDDNKRKT